MSQDAPAPPGPADVAAWTCWYTRLPPDGPRLRDMQRLQLWRYLLLEHRIEPLRYYVRYALTCLEEVMTKQPPETWEALRVQADGQCMTLVRYVLLVALETSPKFYDYVKTWSAAELPGLEALWFTLGSETHRLLMRYDDHATPAARPQDVTYPTVASFVLDMCAFALCQ